MDYQFTPGAERVLIHATGWSEGGRCRELTTPALLLGLLAESECRAAMILTRHGITEQTVRQQWPALTAQTSIADASSLSGVVSGAVSLALQSAYERIIDYLSPPVLETDHLLLGLLVGSDEVADWLHKQGVSAQTIEVDIQNRYQHQPPPGTLDLDPSWSGPSPSSSQDIETDTVAPFAPNPSPLSPLPSPLLRTLDAAANRAREGLRVLEDYVRFVLDDRHLTERCKRLRHDLVAVLQRFAGEHLLAARETQADVGTTLTAAGEETRQDQSQLLTANFARLQESLRSLEEFGKLALSEFAAAIKQFRYRSYTLHRAVEITRYSAERLAGAKLYVLLDGRSTLNEFRQLAGDLVKAGVHVLQLREKNLDDRQLLERARLLRELTAGTATLLIMNDRPDLAALARADGVHLGQEEISVKDARTIVGPTALVGVSTHSLEQARQAVLDGANYIGVGPTFPSDTKTFDQFPGLELLKTVAAEIRLPAFAIGGIHRENLGEVLATDITRIAVRQSVLSAPDPAAAARELLAALGVCEFSSPSEGEGVDPM